MSEPDFDIQSVIHEDLKQKVRVLQDLNATLKSEKNVLTDKLEQALDHMKDMEQRWMKNNARVRELEKANGNCWRSIESLEKANLVLTKELDELRKERS